MAAVPAERIESPSFMLRGHKVMLSPDLADLYEVEPGALVQAVKQNIERFPADFMFQLSPGEFEKFEVTNCDFKLGRTSPRGPVCLHRTGCRHEVAYIAASRYSAVVPY